MDVIYVCAVSSAEGGLWGDWGTEIAKRGTGIGWPAPGWPDCAPDVTGCKGIKFSRKASKQEPAQFAGTQAVRARGASSRAP